MYHDCRSRISLMFLTVYTVVNTEQLCGFAVVHKMTVSGYLAFSKCLSKDLDVIVT